MSEIEAKTLELQGQLEEAVSLADYTSWRTGGEADYVYRPKDLSDLTHFLKQLPITLPLYWLGLGSNTLVRDGGFKGMVIITQGALQAISALPSELIRAEAGVSSAQLARYAARLGSENLAFMAGIPGTIGGALAMNAGCFGGETWQWVHAVETIDRKGNIRIRPISDYQVGYRHVVHPNEDEWFVAGHFKLTPGDKAAALQKIKVLLDKRNTTQPTGTANCGSVFRNPPDHYAGQLIEACGLKGFQIGGAKVSDKHANFIINEEDATAADIEAVINFVMLTVAEEKSVNLVPEVRIIGNP